MAYGPSVDRLRQAHLPGRRCSSNAGPTHVHGGPLATATVRTVPESVLTLYQAEWCPFSSAVRQVLTELGLHFVARQVEPWPHQRAELRRMAGTEDIPVLQAEDGRVYRGTREIFAYLRERDPSEFAAGHRRRYAEHREARETDSPGRLLEHFP